MNETNFSKIAKKLSEPFPIWWHEVKPGAGGGQGQVLALPFIPWHYYHDRLDRVVGIENWSHQFRFVGDDLVYCEITILGVTKGDYGEVEEEEAPAANSKRKGANPLFSGLAQSFRRACAVFGLGRYLYQLGKYYATKDGYKITEPAAEIVHKLLEARGLDPYTRHRRALTEAKTREELKEAAELIRYAGELGEYNEAERAKLKEFYLDRMSAITASAPSSVQVMTNPPGVVPSATDQKMIKEAAATMATAKAPPVVEAKPSKAGGFVPSERAQALSKDIAELSADASEKDLYYRALRQSIADAGRLGDISEAECAELLNRLRGKVGAPQKAQGMRPPDYDQTEQKVRGATTEEREAEYMRLIAEAKERKHLDAYAKEIQTDRLLVSSAVSRLKKKINDKEILLGTTKAEAAAAVASRENAKVQSHGLPEVSQAVRKVEGLLRGVRDELALDTLLGDVSRSPELSAKDLDYLDPLFVKRREGIRAAAAEMAKSQEPLL